MREVATVIEGCLAARSAGATKAEELLTIAVGAWDFLVWAQELAGTGVFLFPAVRNGKGRPFEVAERFFQRAHKDGKLDQVIRNGWSVEDFDDGGLQFDNGLAGVALVRLFEATKDEKYKKAAIWAANWALKRRVVRNWNYNSFSIQLLAEVYRITGDKTCPFGRGQVRVRGAGLAGGLFRGRGRQELIKLIGGGDWESDEDVLERGPRVEAELLAAGGEAGEGGESLAAVVGAEEEPVLPVMRRSA